jgi:hypothetical protein
MIVQRELGWLSQSGNAWRLGTEIRPPILLALINTLIALTRGGFRNTRIWSLPACPLVAYNYMPTAPTHGCILNTHNEKKLVVGDTVAILTHMDQCITCHNSMIDRACEASLREVADDRGVAVEDVITDLTQVARRLQAVAAKRKIPFAQVVAEILGRRASESPTR